MISSLLSVTENGISDFSVYSVPVLLGKHIQLHPRVVLDALEVVNGAICVSHRSQNGNISVQGVEDCLKKQSRILFHMAAVQTSLTRPQVLPR